MERDDLVLRPLAESPIVLVPRHAGARAALRSLCFSDRKAQRRPSPPGRHAANLLLIKCRGRMGKPPHKGAMRCLEAKSSNYAVSHRSACRTRAPISRRPKYKDLGVPTLPQKRSRQSLRGGSNPRPPITASTQCSITTIRDQPAIRTRAPASSTPGVSYSPQPVTSWPP